MRCSNSDIAYYGCYCFVCSQIFMCRSLLCSAVQLLRFDCGTLSVHFVLQGTTDLFEGQTAHFEAQVEPLHDPNLRIEFYHNGKPLPSASRFHITFDFGYVALDITHVVPEDAGEYTVKAINNLGQCTSSINLRVQGMPCRNSVTRLIAGFEVSPAVLLRIQVHHL